MTGCTAPRHGDDPPPTEPHAQLCTPCRLTLTRQLRRLPGLDTDLEHLLVTHRPGGHGDGAGLPVNEPVSDCRSQIRHDIRWWAACVSSERESWPPFVPEPRQLAAWCGWLAGQATWCTFREWAPDMAAAIHENHGRALALLDPWVTKRFEIPGPDGVCDCGGRMVVTVYARVDDKRRSFIACRGCGARWEPEQWLRLGREIIKRREAVA